MAKQNKGRKFFATTATAALVASAIVPVASAAVNDASSIPSWAKDAVDYLTSNGSVQGDAKGNFNPTKEISRAEAATIIFKELGLSVEGTENFSDVHPGNWFYDAVVATSPEIFNGDDNGKFNPNQNLTREQAAKVIVEAFGLTGSQSITSFGDYSKVAGWAKSSFETAVANGVINGKSGLLAPKDNITKAEFATMIFRAVEVAPSLHVEGVTAINATTVEVNYKENIDDIKALKFAIEGLEIKNAVVKQTDKSVAVITTSTQEAGKTYTVTEGGNKLGSFQGISAVIPTAIKVTTPSVQGTIGKEVTVAAQVTVPDGQSKAGIPVTFNIVSDNANLNSKVEVVAYTNEEGIASYSYTRYYEHNDSFTAYATDKSSVFASGKVYWAEALTLTEVTEGNELANGAKKVYKIKTDSWVTETNGTASTADDYNYVNVAFVENTDVSPDKLVRDVEVIDTGVTTNAKYPSQVTTGGVNEVRVKVNAAGEATFTLTGSNSSVTPVVFVDANKNGKYAATELQAKAPTVKFDLKHTLGLKVVAEGVQNAAAINANGTGQGGRDYTVTVTDKDGKLAPEGTLVHVVFPEGSFSTDRAVYFTSKAEGTRQISKDVLYTAKVGKEGKATFTLTGNKDGFAEPTVFINNGTDDLKLDKSDLQTVGEKTFFVNAVVNGATLVAEVNGKEVETTSGSSTVDFIYTSVDQNGKKYAATTPNYEVSYEVTAQFGDVYAGPASTLVKKGTTATIKVNAVNGVATLQVRPVDPSVASQVTVNASASQVSLPNKAVTVNFTNSLELPATHTGYVTNLDVTNERIKLDHYNAVSYANGTFFNIANQQINKSEFVTALQGVASTNKAQVTATKQADGSYKFNIISLTVVKTPAEILAESKATLASKVAAANAKVQAEYTAASWAAFTTARTAAAALPEGTQTEVDTKIAAYDAAVALLVTNSSEEAAQQAATTRLNAAKAAAATKVQANYTTASWSALTTALAIADETTANQKNAKALAIETAIAGLVSKASFASFTIAVDETNANAGTLLLTFTETSATPVTGFTIGTVSTVNGAVAGTVATAAPAGTPDNTVTIKVTDGAATPTAIDLTAAANQGTTYTFTGTVTKADFFAKDVVVEVKFDGTNWVAVIK